jgi:diacylglycerol O-acyltransferase / wax synthase
MASQRLAPLETSLFRLESAGHPAGLVALTLCEGPEPDIERVRARVVKLLPSVPRFAAVAQEVPFALERPVWADAPHFDVADHVFETSLEVAHGDDPVAVLADRLATATFAPDRPRWTIQLVTGLPQKRWILAAHLHVALIDGLRSADLYSCVLVPRVTPPAAQPFGPAPNGPQLIRAAARDLATSPYEQVRFLRATLRRLRPEPPPPPPAVTYRGRTVFSLDELKGVRDAHGGSVNDVLAAMVASAMGDVDGRSDVNVTVPFAVRSLSEPGQYDSQVEAAEIQLPTSAANPVEHYRGVARRLDRIARDNLAVGGRLLGRVSGPSLFVMLALGSRGTILSTADVLLVNTPGPPKTGAVFSGRSIEAHALVPHPAGVRWCVTSVSHGGRVSVGVSGHDPDAVAKFIAGLERAYSGLAPAAKGSSG